MQPLRCASGDSVCNGHGAQTALTPVAACRGRDPENKLPHQFKVMSLRPREQCVSSGVGFGGNK
jgi:hypothetical protein